MALNTKSRRYNEESVNDFVNRSSFGPSSMTDDLHYIIPACAGYNSGDMPSASHSFVGSRYKARTLFIKHTTSTIA
jgi:hypothetical protein